MSHLIHFTIIIDWNFSLFCDTIPDSFMLAGYLPMYIDLYTNPFISTINFNFYDLRQSLCFRIFKSKDPIQTRWFGILWQRPSGRADSSWFLFDITSSRSTSSSQSQGSLDYSSKKWSDRFTIIAKQYILDYSLSSKTNYVWVYNRTCTFSL